MLSWGCMPQTTAPASTTSYETYVNPQWLKLLNVLDMNVRYERCSGTELQTADGRSILDFLSGYCVHNTGHNHPAIIAALKDELDRSGPAMLQSHVPELAGELAERLCRSAGGRMRKVYSTTAEGRRELARAYHVSRKTVERVFQPVAANNRSILACGNPR